MDGEPLKASQVIEELLGDKQLPDPERDQIHVLVQVPKRSTSDRSENPRRDSTGEWLTEFLARKIEAQSLPFVGSLRDVIAQALPVKIRVRAKWLARWSAVPVLLCPQLLEKMFLIDDEAPCKEFKALVVSHRQLKSLRS